MPILIIILLTGCGGGFGEESEPCAHCWHYAGMALIVGNIEAGFRRADDELDKACNENNSDFTNSCADYPETASILKALKQNEFEDFIYFRHPEIEDFEWCAEEWATCVVFYRNGWDFETDDNFNGDPDDKPAGHYMAYDYHSGLLYDNCHCWHGCNNFGNHEYLGLYVALHGWPPGQP